MIPELNNSPSVSPRIPERTTRLRNRQVNPTRRKTRTAHPWRTPREADGGGLAGRCSEPFWVPARILLRSIINAMSSYTVPRVSTGTRFTVQARLWTERQGLKVPPSAEPAGFSRSWKLFCV